MFKITKAVAEKILADVPQEKRFRCHDGRVLKSLPELEAELKVMSEETFRYHLNDTKSDFSNWVRDVVGDETLSRKLQKDTNRAQAAKRVADRIAWLKSKIAAA